MEEYQVTKTESINLEVDEQFLACLWKINNNLCCINTTLKLLAFSICCELFAILIAITFVK